MVLSSSQQLRATRLFLSAHHKLPDEVRPAVGDHRGIASTIILPISDLLFVAIARTWPVSAGVLIFLLCFSSSLTSAETALPRPCVHRVPAGGDGLPRPLGRYCAATIAVVVPSSAISFVLLATSRTFCTPTSSSLSQARRWYFRRGLPYIGAMVKRESWTLALRCPTCATAGDAVVSADEHSSMQAAGTLRVDRMPDGFRVRKLGDTMRTTQFECVKCGGLARR